MSRYIQSLKLNDLFSDEESQLIFRWRDLYSQTGDMHSIASMCETLYQKKSNITLKKQLGSCDQVVAFGCGAIGHRTVTILNMLGIPVDYYCDNDIQKWGTVHLGKKVISPQQLSRISGKTAVIITTSIPSYIMQIKQQLAEMEFPESNILIPCKIMGDQYFDLPAIHPSTNGIFIDAGCFNGDDSLNFIHWSKQKYQSIVAFEPDEKNFKNCHRALSKYPNITLYPYALWSSDNNVSFVADQSGSSHIEQNTGGKISSIKLDTLLKETPVTYIKMDIEGAELEALYGAQQIIQAYRPQLAICVYHKPNDIYDIPFYLKNLVPEYHFYLRHYSLCDLETVLYAIAGDSFQNKR